MIRLLSVAITGSLEPYAHGFAAHLQALGYTQLSARSVLRLFAHLSRWLTARGLGPRALTVARVDAFVRSRRRAGYTAMRSPRALERALEFLRGLGVAPAEPVARPRTPLDRLLARYQRYLQDERALAPSTIRYCVATAGDFLTGTPTIASVRTLAAVDVLAFLRRLGPTHSRSLAGVGSNLRCLLRFLFVAGLHRQDLSPAVPSSASGRDRSLARGLSATDLRRLLSSCDRRTLVGQRDFAILLLLARLGLRQGEIVAMTLDDFDWSRGEVVVHGKGKKAGRLPLPDDVGRAVSSYLLRRPRVTTRRVFLRVRAPHQPLSSVKPPVFAASQRAGIAPTRPHRLRHTAATHMLRRGASLEEIAQVLRHSSTYTTTIYAKVDRAALRAVSQPWPGARA